MRSILLATTAAVGLFALPQAALAAAPDIGMVELRLGAGSTDDNFNNWEPFDDPFNYGARTQWLFPLSDPVEVQADFFINQISNLFDNSTAWNDDESTLFGGSVHLIHPMEHGRIAAAGSLFNVDAYGPFLGKNGTGKGVMYGLAALEGQYFTDQFTLMAQGGWFSDISGCDGLEGCIHDAFFLRGNAQYFFSPTMSLSLDANIFFGDDEDFGDVDGKSVRLEGEYMFQGSRFAGFIGVGYETETVDFFGLEASQDTATIDIGLRLYLDGMNLRAFSQDGPSFNTPTFHHSLASEGTLQAEAWSLVP